MQDKGPRKKGPHKRGRGLAFGLLGLLCGLILGALYLLAEHLIARTLIGVLEDELDAACPECRLVVGEVRFSFLSLQANARGVKLYENDETGKWVSLAVDEIVAKLSVSKLLSRKIVLLDELILLGAQVHTLEEESGAFRFIYYLAEPLPPERDTDERYRLKLLSLTVPPATAKHSFADDLSFSSEQVQFLMSRESVDSDFRMRLVLPKTFIATPQHSFNMSASLDILPDDDYVRIENIRIISPQGLSVKGLVQVGITGEELITGSLEGSLELAELLAAVGSSDSKLLEGAVALTAHLEGNAPNPIFRLSATSPSVSIGGDWSEKVGGAFRLDSALSAMQLDDGLEVILHGAELRNDSVALELSQEVSLLPQSESVQFTLNADRIAFDEVALNNFNAQLLFDGDALSLKGTLSEVGNNISRNGDNGTAHSTAIKDLVLEAELKEGAVTFASRTAKRDIELQGRYELATSILDSSIVLQMFPLGIVDGRLSAHSIDGKVSFSQHDASGELEVFGFGNNIASLQLSRLDNELVAHLTNTAQSLNAQARLAIDTQLLSITGSFDNLSLTNIISDKICMHIGGALLATFPLASDDRSLATIDFEQFRLGCPPLEVTNTAPFSIRLSGSDVELTRTELRSASSTLMLSDVTLREDHLSGEVQGALELELLLPFLPDVDDLRGTLKPNLRLSGDLHNPMILGSARLEQTGFDVSAAGLSGSNFSGALEFDGTTIIVNELRGNVGAGQVQIDGRILPLDIYASEISLTAQSLHYTTEDDIQLTVSGAFLLNSYLETPRITGRLIVDSALFEREFDLRTLTAILLSRLRAITRASSQAAIMLSTTMPHIELDLDIVAPGESFILTNFASVELGGRLKVVGSTNEPEISGAVQTLRGWIGFQNRKFEVSSGELSFSPEFIEPQLAITAESYVPTRFGENLLVFLTIEGPLSQPVVTLSSDSGLPESEVLRLVTTSFGASTALDSHVSFAEYRLYPVERLLQGEITLFEFLRELARLDSVLIEPSFNPRRGGVEPSLVVTKQLSEPLALEGRSYLTGGGEDSSLLARYQLTDRLELRGGLESSSTTDATALAADVGVNILSTERSVTTIQVVGNEALSRRRILQLGGLRRSSTVLLESLPQIESRFQSRVHAEGFLDASVTLSCITPLDNRCQVLEITIDEGSEYTVSAIEFSERSPSYANDLVATQRLVGSTATSTRRQDTERSISVALRERGYLVARVNVDYKRSDSETVTLIIDVVTGNRITIKFSGNSIFSRDDFLNTINLRTRRQPFGPNTANILKRNIEELYRRVGYLQANVEFQREIASSEDAEVLSFTISEGQRVTVAEVLFESTDSDLVERLRNVLEDRFGAEWLQGLIGPEFAVREDIESYALVMEQELIALGRESPRVDWNILAEDEATTTEVFILYTIDPGESAPLFTVSVVDEEGSTISQFINMRERQLSTHRGVLMRELLDDGYRNALLEEEEYNGELRLRLVRGERAKLGKLIIRGLDRVPEHTVRDDLLQLLTDPVLNDTLLREIREKLLRLGLFSRVIAEYVEANGSEGDVYDILLDLQERSLRTLLLGGGAHSELGVHGFGEAIDRSIFLDGKTLGFRFDGYYDLQRDRFSQGVASLRFFEPHLFDTNWKWTEEISFQDYQLAIQEFDLNRVSLNSGLLYADVRDFTFGIGHTFFSERLSSVSSDVVLSPLDSGRVDLSFLSTQIGLDRRDSPVNPRSGWALSLESRLSSELIGSDADYYGVQGWGTVLLPLRAFDHDFVLASHTKLGRSWTFNGTQEVPISQRYYLGGRTSVRGFRESSLGPRGEAGGVLGGDMFFAQNLELQWYVTEFSSVNLFFDTGGLFLNSRGTSSREIRESAGIGLRLLSPIGPIGFDVATPLDERSGEPSIRFHFSIGTIF